ncbi:SURF1 family protein [Streptomyces narbonensis]
MPQRELDGRPGSYVLTLLKTDGGRSLPVVRGWLPTGATAPAPPSARSRWWARSGPRRTRGRRVPTPRAGLPEGQLGMISAAALVNVVNDDVYDAWITLTDSPSGLTPVPAEAAAGTSLDVKAFQNLGYTAEWFVFAGFVLFMWFRLVRREAEASRDEALGLQGVSYRSGRARGV